jgi:isocitrate/isopropylmalate dehydrogenase
MDFSSPARAKWPSAMAGLPARSAWSTPWRRCQFDVIVTTNMFGDILSDEASEIAGSLGIGASLNAGHRYAVAQAQHGSAPDIAGQDLANPSSLIESAAMLLSWLEERGFGANFAAAGQCITRAVDATIAVAANRTRDLGGPLGTKAFTARVVESVVRDQ